MDGIVRGGGSGRLGKTSSDQGYLRLGGNIGNEGDLRLADEDFELQRTSCGDRA